MQTGIALERSIEKPFAVSLANKQTGLPEEIRRDDVLALREEWAVFMNAYGLSGDATYLRKAIQVERETGILLAQAREAGFNTEGW